nr:PadR family transcriptional regulator [Nakamurella lactea]
MGSGGSSVLELAVLGSLAESSMHGYELRKRLSSSLGTLRAFSFGSLYPSLKRLLAAGHIAEESPAEDVDAVPLSSKRSRVVYTITATGKERLADLLADSGPQSWSDDGFGIHLAFFGRTKPEARIRILEGRRRRVEERREGQRSAIARAADRMDGYTEQLQQLGLEATEREVRWLNELIATEQQLGDPGPATAPDPSGAKPARRRGGADRRPS